MSSKLNHRRMPSKEKIFDYWDLNSAKLGTIQEDEWGIVEKECFACGCRFLQLERAHIIPLCKGGDNKVENLHLLCKGCHSESEGLEDYWKWIHYKRKNEWSSLSQELERRLNIIGTSFQKEAEYLESINATQQQLEDLTNSIARKIFLSENNSV